VRTIALERDAKGNWTVDGAKIRGLKAAPTSTSLQPVDETQPIRRLGLGTGASRTIQAA
jgi:hypothetical protein